MGSGSQRGVSETLGFVFIFAIIISMVGLVYASGISGLQDARDAERVENAGRAFDVLAHNIEDISHRGAPSRATEIKLADAQLGLRNPSIIEVTAHVQGDPDDNVSVEATADPIRYTVGGNESFVYENGAVIRQDGGASVMRREPATRITDADTVIPVIVTTGTEDSAIGGTTTVLVRTAQSSTEVAVANSSVKWDGWYNVTTKRTDAWEEYLSSFEATDCSVSGETVSCEFETDRLYVTQYRISVTIEE